MNRSPEIAPVLRAYRKLQVEAGTCTPLGPAGGFSGAQLWRIKSPAGEFCLRRWPAPHPDEARLQLIHSVLRTITERGVREAAVPLETIAGETWVRHEGFFWELTRWMPGRADFHETPRPEKLQAAMSWLAKFHLAAAPPTRNVAPSPGLALRRDLLHRLIQRDAGEIKRLLPLFPWPGLRDPGLRILAAFQRRAASVEMLLAEGAQTACPLQPCIRDIWHDHVLFEGDRVSGVVDFGAMRIECTAGDIARLLGSLVRDDAGMRRIGLEAYCSVRPLAPTEQRLLSIFDASEVLLSGMNWLRWICLERRVFDDPHRVLARLDEILLRLDGWQE